MLFKFESKVLFFRNLPLLADFFKRKKDYFCDLIFNKWQRRPIKQKRQLAAVEETLSRTEQWIEGNSKHCQQLYLQL